jgi:hypothetical protein
MQAQWSQQRCHLNLPSLIRVPMFTMLLPLLSLLLQHRQTMIMTQERMVFCMPENIAEWQSCQRDLPI